MKNFCFIFLTHRWNKEIEELYNSICNQLKTIHIDCVIFYDSILLVNDYKISNKSFKFCYPHSCIWTKFTKKKTGKVLTAVDPFKGIYSIFQQYKSFFDKYDYFYFYEYDVYYNGNFKEYINKLNTLDYDLLAAYIREVKATDDEPWPYIHYYQDFIDLKKPSEYFLQDVKTYIKSCLSFFRISKKMLFKFLDPKYRYLIFNVLYELHVPTLVNYFGGTIKSIGPKLYNQFDMYNDLNSTIYFYNVTWKSIDEIKNLPDQSPLFYTRVKL